MPTRSITDSRARYLQALLASTALVSVGSAQGQTETDTSADAGSAPIEEIVVRGVARPFRAEEQSSATGLNLALIETPQAVSVLTPEMLSTINADSVYEATDLVPGVQKSGYGFGFSQIVMRGIFNLTRRINGIELDNPITTVSSYALDRLEIVRGPATVVYGVTGSFGGEINAILKQPRQSPRFQVGAEVGSYDSRNIYFDATGPVMNDGAISGRLVGRYAEYDLPLDIAGESFPNYESMVLGSVNWDLSPRTTLRVTHYHHERNTDPWDGGALVQTPDGNLALPDADPEQWYFSHPDQSTETATIDFGMVELEHEFDNGWTAESKAAWSKYDEDLAYFYPFGPFGAYSLADDEIYIYSYDVERDGEELTFNQSLGGDFEFFGRDHQFFTAVEYTDDQGPQRFELLNSFFQGFAEIDWYGEGYDGQPRFADGTAFLPVQGDREQLFGVRQVLLEETKDLKVSAQVLLNPTDRMSLLAGVLYHHNDTITTIPFNRGEALSPPDTTEVGFDEAVFRFGATYGLLEDLTLVDEARIYYSYSQGFEPQTFTDADGVTVSAPQEMEQHEIGLKTESFGGAVGMAVALFDYEITNIEVQSTFLGSFGGFGSTVLAGSQQATGLEFEILGEVLPGWNVSANYTWMDAEIINPNNTGSTPPRTTPEHSGAIITTYEFLDGPLAGFRLGATFKASGDYAFVEGTSNVDRFGTLLEAGGHTRFDLRASYAPRGGQFENFEIYFNWQNIFDENILVAKQGNPGYGVMFIDQQKVTAGLRYTFE